MSPSQALLAVARDRGVTIDGETVEFLLADRGQVTAEYFIASTGALMDLASALGQTLTEIEAMAMLERTGGDYDIAAARVIEPVRARRERAFSREFDRCEKRLRITEARARHAVLLSDLANGALGWQASVLLLAAEDARLKDPDAHAYRARLERAVGGEIDRRYPVRREAEWQVIDPDRPAHARILEGAVRDERAARRVALAKLPELTQRIDRLSSPMLRDDVRKCLREIRGRLADRARMGWVADPERYAREVIQAAADSLREAC